MANDYLVHYGVLGMHWGVRRYQPYSVVPRGSGEGGKEVGEAVKSAKSIERANKRIAKRNVKSAFKQMHTNIRNQQILDRKIAKKFNKLEKYDHKGVSEKKQNKLINKIADQVAAKAVYNEMNNKHKAEIIKATEAVGSEYVNKVLDKTKTYSYISDIGDNAVLTAGATAVSNIIGGPKAIFVFGGAGKDIKATKETYKQAKDVVDNKKISNEVHIDASNKSESDNQSMKTTPEIEKRINQMVNNAKTKGHYEIDFLENLSDSQMEKSDAELSKDYEKYLRKIYS